MNVGFIGLGAMGAAMAKNLIAAGHSVSVYNRSREKAAPLEKQGARVADSPADVARGAEVVFSMLADDRAVQEVVFGDTGLLKGLAKGAVHVSSSTISVALSEKLAEAHAQAGQRYVAAPVFGRPEAAAAKALWVMASGAPADVQRCRPLLEAIGRGLTIAGERPSAANVVKLSGNFIIVSLIEALGEAFALVRKSGVEPQALLDVFATAKLPVLETYSKLVAGGTFDPPGFKLRLGLKDVSLALEAAGAVQVPMPLGSLVRDNYLSAVAQGMGELDWAALSLLIAQRAGLK